MSGRTSTQKYNSTIKLLSKIFTIIPLFIQNILWSLSSPFENRLCLLIRYLILHNQCRTEPRNVYIGKNVTIRNLKFLSCGDNVSIHNNCYIDAAGSVSIGANVSIAHATSIVSFEHTWEDIEIPIKYNRVKLSPIYIENDVWIGCGVRILSGVTINSRSVVAAGAVVTKDVPGNSLVAGVPAKFIKNLSSD